MSKKTLKPKRFMFFATFLYGLLFWVLLLLSLMVIVLVATDEHPGINGTDIAILSVLFIATIGMGVLRNVRRKSLSLKLPIVPQDIPYTADEVKHYVGLQENDTFADEYYAMRQAYLTMKKSKMIQIVMSREKNPELRSAAKNYISTAVSKLVMLACPAMYLKDAVPVLLSCDRTIYYLYPHFVLRVGDKKDITAFSYAEFDLDLTEGSRIWRSEEKIPRDAEVIGKAYKYTNKDGSPDMRKKDNPSYPIIKTANIDSEDFDIHYQLSNYDAAEDFYSTFDEFAEKAIQAENMKKALNEAAQQIQDGEIE